jgi:predicted sulfurtransferase
MLLVDIKPEMTVMKSKYVVKIKKKLGNFARYKARLVALGYDQEINPQLIFAPVVKPDTVKIMMALADVCRMFIYYTDISNDFCYVDTRAEYSYMR